jgi:hypothetical protein
MVWYNVVCTLGLCADGYMIKYYDTFLNSLKLQIYIIMTIPTTTFIIIIIIIICYYFQILHSNCIKDLGVMLNTKLYFHCHANFVHSHVLWTLGLKRYITYNFCSWDSLVVLDTALIRSKLEYASVICNNLILTDSNKIWNIKRTFSNLCYYLFFLSLIFYVIMI